MKLINLNLWGGRVYPQLIEFLKENSKKIDIFCFQEVYSNATESLSDEPMQPRLNLFKDLKDNLQGYNAFFRPVIKNIYGIGIFVKNDISVLDEGEINIYNSQDYPGRGGNHSRNLEWIRIKSKGKIYSIFNVHGLHNGKGKSDTPERLAQSEKIKEFMLNFNNPKILCGDFNLLPETESIKILDENMSNLIKKNGVKSTRSNYYQKELKFADYVFVSPDVNVKRFEILQDSVSDHLPLLLDFE